MNAIMLSKLHGFFGNDHGLVWSLYLNSAQGRLQQETEGGTWNTTAWSDTENAEMTSDLTMAGAQKRESYTRNNHLAPNI